MTENCLNTQYQLSIPSSVSRGVGQHEVGAGDDDAHHEGGGDDPPHQLPVQPRAHTWQANISVYILGRFEICKLSKVNYFQVNFIVTNKNKTLLLANFFSKVSKFYLILLYVRDKLHLNPKN